LKEGTGQEKSFIDEIVNQTNKQTQILLELSSATSALMSPAGGAINLSQLQNDQQQTKQDFK
jgi:hypothetical protein